MDDHLPRGGELERLLGLTDETVADLVGAALLDPLEEFLGRPGKKFRGELVRLAYLLSGGCPREGRLCCARGAALLEQIHAGSLVVDDIQDESLERRGAPALHRQHGLPKALNAGNWLYFWPLEGIRTWGLDPDRELRLYQVCHSALLRAHFGQALDVGVPIDELPRDRMEAVALASLELKTGALTALATGLGAVLGRADEVRLQGLSHFGKRFGIALQMLDDLGNFTGRGKGDPKRWEDLRLRRPSWIWATVARCGTEEDLVQFRGAVARLPEEADLLAWAERTDLIGRARRDAEAYLEEALGELSVVVGGGEVFDELADLCRRLAGAYR